MKIIAVNKDISGYPNEMGYNNPDFKAAETSPKRQKEYESLMKL